MFCCSLAPEQETIELNESKKTYDRVFDPSATQQEVFDYVAKPLVSGESPRWPPLAYPSPYHVRSIEWLVAAATYSQLLQVPCGFSFGSSFRGRLRGNG